MWKIFLATIVALMAAAFLSTCVEVFDYEMLPTLITVVQGPDRAPVSQVLVRVRYNYENMMFTVKLNSPSPAEGTTNDFGAVVLPIADFRNGVLISFAEHPGDPSCQYFSTVIWREQIRSGGGEFTKFCSFSNGERGPALRMIVQRPAPES